MAWCAARAAWSQPPTAHYSSCHKNASHILSLLSPLQVKLSMSETKVIIFWRKVKQIFYQAQSFFASWVFWRCERLVISRQFGEWEPWKFDPRTLLQSWEGDACCCCCCCCCCDLNLETKNPCHSAAASMFPHIPQYFQITHVCLILNARSAGLVKICSGFLNPHPGSPHPEIWSSFRYQ